MRQIDVVRTPNLAPTYSESFSCPYSVEYGTCSSGVGAKRGTKGTETPSVSPTDGLVNVVFRIERMKPYHVVQRQHSYPYNEPSSGLLNAEGFSLKIQTENNYVHPN